MDTLACIYIYTIEYTSCVKLYPRRQDTLSRFVCPTRVCHDDFTGDSSIYLKTSACTSVARRQSNGSAHIVTLAGPSHCFPLPPHAQSCTYYVRHFSRSSMCISTSWVQTLNQGCSSYILTHSLSDESSGPSYQHHNSFATKRRNSWRGTNTDCVFLCSVHRSIYLLEKVREDSPKTFQ